MFRRAIAAIAKRAEWWCVPIAYALVLVWIYRGLWHQHGVPTGLGWDTIDTHGPDLDFFASELREGRFSLWNPYDKGGYPVFCDPVFDRYYPFNWPFAAWGALFGSSWWLVQIKVIAHHAIGACCMHLFLRTRGLSVRASFVGGIALVASAPLLTHKASNIIWPMMWVPLVWLAIDAALERPTWRRGVALAAAFSLCATAGSPPGLFYSMLLVLPYGVVRAVTVLRGRWSRDEAIRLAVCFGAAAVVAGLVLAVTVLPTSEVVALGSRDRFARGREFALALSLPLPAAIRGVFVRGAGLFEMYLGATVVMLAACALVLRPKFDRGVAITLWAIAAFGVWLASGATGKLLPVLVDHVPGFALLRVPGRYKLLAAWALAAAAGFGFAALEAAPRKKRLAILAGASVAISIVCVVAWPLHYPNKDRPVWWSPIAMAVAGSLVVAAAWLPKKWVTLPLGALGIGVLLDAPLFTFVSPGALPAAEVRQTHERDAVIASKLDGARDRYRIHDEFILGERAGARLRLRDFRGYPALDPLSQKRYVEVLDYAKLDPRIVTDFNVRWVLKRPHFRYGDSASFVRLPHSGFVPRSDGIWEAEHPAPIVAWYGAATIERDRKRVLAAVRALEDPDGVRRRVLIEDDFVVPPAYLIAPPDMREGAITSYEPDAITFTIDAPRDGLVVLNEIWFPGWRVSVDGDAAIPVRANSLLRAVWVTAGHHEVTWTFSPPRWRVLVGGYLLALAIMLAAAVAPRRRGSAAG